MKNTIIKIITSCFLLISFNSIGQKIPKLMLLKDIYNVTSWEKPLFSNDINEFDAIVSSLYAKRQALNDSLVILNNRINNISVIGTSQTYSFNNLTSKPTTLAGYGITNAYPLSGNPSGFLTGVTYTNVVNALSFTPYNSTNPSNYTTLSSVSGIYTPIANPIHTGDIETTTLNAAVIIKSPNGTRFRLSVSNAGDIIATSL